MRDLILFALLAGALVFAFTRLRFWARRIQPVCWGAEKAPMQVDCMYCRRTMSSGRRPVSHGVCRDCEAAVRAEFTARREALEL